MTLRVHAFVFLFAISLAAPTVVQAAECQYDFDLLGGKVNTLASNPAFRNIPRWVLPPNLSAKQAKAYEKLFALEQKSVRDIFPKTYVNGAATEVSVPDHETLVQYRKLFDDIWNARREAGIIPRFDLDDYRYYLRTNSALKEPYPDHDAAKLFTDYWEKDRALADYFDAKFLEYWKVKKGINNPESLAKVLESLDPSYAHYILRSIKNTVRAIPSGFKAAATVSVPLTLATFWINLPVDLVNKVIAPWKDWGYGQVQAGWSFLNEKFGSWWIGFKNGKELEDAVSDVDTVSGELTKTPFDKLVRSAGADALQVERKKYEATLPKFKTFLDHHNKDFDKNLGAELERMVTLTRDAYRDYDMIKNQLDRLQKEIDEDTARGVQRDTFDDARRLRILEQRKSRNEDDLAAILSRYLLYTGTRGATNPPERFLSMQYEKVFEDYLQNMSLPKLQRAWLNEVNGHMLMLKSFMPKQFVNVSVNNAEEALEKKKKAEEAKAAEEQKKADAQTKEKAAENALAEAKKKAESQAADGKPAGNQDAAAAELIEKQKAAVRAAEEARKAAEAAKKAAEEAKAAEENAKKDPTAPAQTEKKADDKTSPDDAKKAAPAAPAPSPAPAPLSPRQSPAITPAAAATGTTTPQN